MLISLRIAIVAAAAVTAVATQAQAQERALERLEITMTLLPDEAATGPEAITRHIELPVPPVTGEDRPEGNDSAEQPGVEKGRDGTAKAAEAREQGRDFGQSIAEQAREQGRDFGQSIAEQARENRENIGRSDNPSVPPVDLPGNANGGPPDNIGGRPTP